MGEWRETTWGAVGNLNYGRALPTVERGESGAVEVFGTVGPIGFTDRKALGAGPKLIIGRKGAYRGVTLARGPFWVIDTAYWLDLDATVDPFWAYYSLKHADINSLGSGSAIPSTTREDFYALNVSLPNLGEQRAIAEVLGALDDKIAANTRLAATADELARLCFRRMVNDSNRREPLSQTARFVNGRNFTKGATGTGRVVIRIAELNSGLTGSTVRNEVDACDDNVARPGDLLFAWSGSLTLSRWFRDEGVVNQHIFKVIPNSGYPTWLIHQLILDKLEQFRAIAADKATTMGHIQRRHLDELVTVPSKDSIAAEDAGMAALWERALLAERENLSLAAIRDTLLPQLMSGSVRMREAQEVVDAL
ncbi:restriction endonuclease subunit S [Promicromonospora sp. Marseille-Q5078]